MTWMVLLILGGCRDREDTNTPAGALAGTVALADDGDPTGTTVTIADLFGEADATGAYAIADVPAGTWTVTARLDGYVDATGDVAIDEGIETLLDLVLDAVPPDNVAPVVTSLSVAPSTLLPGGTAVATVAATDADGDALTVTWAVTGAFTVVDDTATTALLTAPPEQGAIATLTVTVSDGVATATATLPVRTVVFDNAPPVITSLVVDPAQIAPGGTANITAVGSDPEGGALTWSWSATNGFSATGDDTATLTAPGTPGTSGTLTATLTDDAGATATVSVGVSTSTPVDGAPVIAAISATPPTVAPGGAIALSIAASDPEGAALTTAWTAPTGWTLSSTTSATPTLTAPATPGATATISVTVSDGANDATGTIGVSTRANTAPTIASLAMSPGTIANGQTVDVAVSASDLDGDALTYAWSATGGFSISGTGASVDLSAPATRDTPGTVSVTVTDAHGGSTTADLAVRTTPNRAPVVGSVVATPTLVARDGTSALLATATDADGDPLTYAWTLSDAGWGVTTGSASATLTGSGLPDDEVTATVTVTDGFGGTATGTVAVSTRPNAPPVVTAVDVPTPIRPTAAAAVTVSAYDPDPEDTVSLTFTVDDPYWTVVNLSGDVTVTAPATPGAEATLTVIASDGITTTETTVVLRTTDTCGPGLMERGGVCETCGVDAVLAANPYAFWRLNETSGTVANDAVGSRDGLYGPGVVLGVPTAADDGDLGIRTTGINLGKPVIVPATDFPGTALTVSLWVRAGGTDRALGMFSWATPVSDNEFLIYNLNALAIYVRGSVYSTGLALADGDWHHLAVSWRSADGQLQVYVDGGLEVDTTFRAGVTLASVGTVDLGEDQDAIGGSNNDGGGFDGAIDDVAVFSGILDADTIAAIAERATCGEVCNGVDDDEDGDVDEGRYGTGPACPAEDCADVLASGESWGSGAYWIDPLFTTSPRRALCDMEIDGGGWTQCLNSRYTAAAAPLFTSTYAHVQPGADNVTGYYDYCPLTADEYVMGLATSQSGGGYSLGTAVVQLHDPVPWVYDSSEWNDRGVQATDLTWHTLSTGTFGCSGPISVSFWEFVHPAPRGLHGYKRGHFYCHESGLDIFLFGAGCNYQGCGNGTSSSVAPPVFTDSESSPGGWAWRVRATVGEGNHNASWTAGPSTADRIAIYYR